MVTKEQLHAFTKRKIITASQPYLPVFCKHEGLGTRINNNRRYAATRGLMRSGDLCGGYATLA